MTHDEMIKKVKEDFDQYCDESDMYTLKLLWMIEGIDGNYPLHDALEIAYEIQKQYHAVKNGIIPHW